jgi:hypothetical protein
VLQRLAELGDPEPDAKAVKKYLRVVRPRYKQLVVSMEAFVDISKLSIEEITGTLKSSDDAEEDTPPAPNSATGKLLLTHEEWMERYRQGDSARGGSSTGSGGRGKGRGGGKTRGRGGRGSSDRRSEPAASAPRRAGPDDECKRCGKKGHWAQHCRGKLKVDAEAHVAHEDEPTLMYACGLVEEERSKPLTSLLPIRPLPALLHSAAGQDPAPPQPLKLVEAKVFATFGAPGDQDLKRWVLDTGATNHMTGSRDAFSDLDTGVVGTVRFGDGSVVAIEGRGTVLFALKNGEHQILANTYYIPRLTTNIVSIGQLDEAGFQVLVEHSVLRIRDEERCLLAKVNRNVSRLYILDANIARPVCWAAHAKEDA